METLVQDIRQSLRALRKSPGFSIAAIVTLALGVGATAVLFSILDGAYIHFGPTEQTNRAVILTQRFTKLNSESWFFSAPEYFDIVRAQYPLLGGVFADNYFSPTLDETKGAGNPEPVPVVRATANIFGLYAMSPIFGRVFTAEEDRPGGENVAVVTYRLWRRRYHQDPGIVGSTIKLDGVSYTVIGITPRRFQQWGADIYIPLHLDPAAGDRSQRDLRVAAIPKKGVSLRELQQQLQVVARRVEAEYKASNPEYAGLIYVPVDIRTAVVGDLRYALYILLAAAGLLVFIAAANIANLLLARVISRAGEIGVRLALGASQFRVARQFLTESVLLGSVAGVLGFALGVAALNPTLALIPPYFIGEEAEVHASPSGFLISMLVALLLSAAFGLLPLMLFARRRTAENLLHRHRRTVTDRRGGRARLLLVTAEMTLAFVVVVAAGLMVRTYSHLASLNLGFRSDHVLTMRIALPESKYRGSVEIINFFQDLATRVRSLPGVTDLAFASAHPLGRQSFRDFTIPGRSLSSAGGLANAAYRIVSPGYFTTIRTPLHEGRLFSENDGPGSPNVALVNESFARTWFPNQDAVGKEIQLHGGHGRDTGFGSANDTVQIVGVVGSSKHVEWGHVQDLEQTPTPEIYVPLRQHATRDMTLLLRTSSDPGALTDAVRQRVLSIDSDQPVYDVETLQEAASEALGPVRLAVVVLGGFGSMALLIASVGLYAVLAYSVAQRTQEIGIRMALGARRSEILRWVVAQGLTWAGAGLALGMFVALSLTRLMSSLLYGVRPNDISTFGAVAAVLVTVALVASIVPALRATKVDPMVALRYE